MRTLMLVVALLGSLSTPAAAAGRLLTAAQLDPAFSLITEAIADGTIPGASVLVAQHGQIVREEAFGWSDVERRIPFTTDTIAWLASITKPVTATAAMKLVEEGRIRLDDPVGRYLPEFAPPRAGAEHQRITIYHLLTHTSGLPANPPGRRDRVWEPSWIGRPLSDTIAPIAAAELAFPPGSAVEYSSSAYYVLGRIIEVVAGQPYEQYVQGTILAPLGMEDCYYPTTLPESEAERIATVYRRTRDRRDFIVFRFDPQLRRVNSLPDGGLFCTARDLFAFYQMFLTNDGRVLTQSLVAEMLREQVPGRGLGWSRRHGGFAHGGSSGAWAWGDPETGVVGVVLFQKNDLAAQRVARLRSEFTALVRAASGNASVSPAFEVDLTKPWAFPIDRAEPRGGSCQGEEAWAMLESPAGQERRVEAECKNGEWVARTRLDEAGIWEVTTGSTPPHRRLTAYFAVEATAGRPRVK